MQYLFLSENAYNLLATFYDKRNKFSEHDAVNEFAFMLHKRYPKNCECCGNKGTLYEHVWYAEKNHANFHCFHCLDTKRFRISTSPTGRVEMVVIEAEMDEIHYESGVEHKVLPRRILD